MSAHGRRGRRRRQRRRRASRLPAKQSDKGQLRECRTLPSCAGYRRGNARRDEKKGTREIAQRTAMRA
eukprot:3100615-Pyramimonas_sp.AAC.1